MEKTNLLWLRRMHGAMYEKRLARKQKYFDAHIAEIGRKESLRVAKQTQDAEEDYPIDFVVTWVDGNDPEWQAQKNNYLPNDRIINQDNPAARFRDWETFHYWFRSVEKYAHWVRNVYLITWGHLPKWLNLNNPKLKIVRHDDFIPAEYLPTFNSNTIELNLWRIKSLSENFVYFNDDMFLTKPVLKRNFFHNGFPKYCAVAKPFYAHSEMTSWEHMLFNDIGMINSFFRVNDCIAENCEKWFSYKYGKMSEYNVRAYKDGYLTGIVVSHLGCPLRRSTMEEIWTAYESKLHYTCLNRFRTHTDNELVLVEMWEMLKGSFDPVEADYYGFARNITVKSIDRIEQEILSNENCMVCANDSEQIDNDEYPFLKQRMTSIMQKKYPEKSSFEL